MKYGQTFASALSGTSEEFQQASIDYKQLKKSIKRIEKELNALGLNAEVLRELLSVDELDENSKDASSPPSSPQSSERLPSNAASSRPAGPARTGSSGRSLPTLTSLRTSPQQKPRKRRKRKQARARAEYELAGTADHPIPRIRLVFSSESSGSDSLDGDHGKNDLYDRVVRHTSARIVELDDSASASDTPLQKYEAEQAPLESSEEVKSSASLTEDDSKEEEGDEPEHNTLMDRLYGRGILPADQVTPPGSPATIRPKYINGWPGAEITPADGEEGEAVVHGPDILLHKLRLEDEEAAAEQADAEGEEGDIKLSTALSRPESIKSEGARKKRRSGRSPRRGRREVVINLEYDSEFFAMLNQALTSLTALMNAEKNSFMQSVQALAAIVSRKASPTKSKNDVYAWRQVFTLWVEAEIFEGAGESSRGERAIQEIEKRLDWFVDQIGRRNLAKEMRSKSGRKALERFVELNQELLQLKRIGLANQEAARKILKKHDKRLGLSASQDFPDFVAQQNRLSNGSASDKILATKRGNEFNARSALARTATSNEMTSLIFIGLTTLPHALLTIFTDILLPIVPQIDDYSCIICSDIAWRPIALDCGHRFCVRCLVKMQKRGQDACPACRAPVVLTASKENLDTALMAYQRTWFPKEIRQKQRDDAKEIEKEQADELDLPANKCLVM